MMTRRAAGRSTGLTGWALEVLLAAVLGWIGCPAHAAFGTQRLLMEEYFNSGMPQGAAGLSGAEGAFRIDRGELVLPYYSNQADPPAGIHCTLPISSEEIEERQTVINFAGGGSTFSNSLFVAYAVGGRGGWSLPQLPAGAHPNNRTGYIVRLIRHGDGSNEIKIYRNDGGWTKQIVTDTLPSNPTSTLRRLAIQHRRSGDHRVTVSLDTGVPFEQALSFFDPAYPPGDQARGLQVMAKGHSVRHIEWQIRTDSWTVRDRIVTGPRIPIPPMSPAGAARPDEDTEGFEILEQRGRAELAQGNHRLAIGWLEKALKGSQKRHGSESMQAASILHLLAQVHRSKDPDESIRFYRKAIEIFEKRLPPADLQRLIPLIREISEIYRTQQMNTAAVVMFRKALAIQEKATGRDHPDYAQTLADMAAVYRSEGRLEPAVSAYREALTILERRLMADHPQIESILYQLENLYRTYDRYDEAETYALRSLKIREKLLGPDHPALADNLNDLAMANHLRADFARAESLFRRVLAIREKSIGSTDPKLAGTLTDLSIVISRQGRPEEAAALLVKAVALRQKVTPAPESEIADNLALLSTLYRSIGNLLASETTALQALDLYRRLHGGTHEKVSGGEYHLGAVHFDLGRLDESLRHLSKSLEIQESIWGRQDTRLLATLNKIVEVHIAQDRHAEAAPYLTRLIPIHEKVFGSHHPDLATALNLLAFAHTERGDHTAAEKLSLRALSIQERALGPGHPEVGQTLSQLALIAYAEKRFPESIGRLKRSIRILEEAPGPDTILVVGELNNLGVVYRAQGDSVESERTFQRAIDLMTPSRGSTDVELGSVWSNLGMLYSTTRQWSKAARAFQEALAIQERMLGPGHPDLLTLIDALADIHQHLSNPARSRSYLNRAKKIRSAGRQSYNAEAQR